MEKLKQHEVPEYVPLEIHLISKEELCRYVKKGRIIKLA